MFYMFDDDPIPRKVGVKMPLDEDIPTEFLVEEKRYEADFQPSGHSADTLKETLLNEEEEIIDTFLLSLKSDQSFNDDLGIHSNQIANEIFIDNFSSSIYGFTDLDCGSNAETCDGTLEKEKDGMCGMFYDNLVLERNEENRYSRVDPMLDEASLWLQIDHDIEDHVQELNLDDNIFGYYASSIGKVSTFSFFSLKWNLTLWILKINP